jgi:hypothetical protein
MRKIIAPILVMLFISCQDNELKTDVTPETNAIEALNEYALINQIFQDVGNNSGDAVLSAESSATGKISQSKNGPIITVEPFDFVTFPKTTTVDFGDGTLCEDGITRKGIITIVSTKWYGKEGSLHTSTFNDYYHGKFKVEGTHVVENLGKNEDDFLEFSVSINNGKVTAEDGESVSFSEESFRTWIAGSNTPLNIWDDEYLLEGVQSGTSSKGVDYTLTIEEALHFVLLPRSIESGILDMEIGDVSDIKVNYTFGTITILGKTYSWN